MSILYLFESEKAESSRASRLLWIGQLLLDVTSSLSHLHPPTAVSARAEHGRWNSILLFSFFVI